MKSYCLPSKKTPPKLGKRKNNQNLTTQKLLKMTKLEINQKNKKKRQNKKKSKITNNKSSLKIWKE